jgi:hypothetical protein
MGNGESQKPGFSKKPGFSISFVVGNGEWGTPQLSISHYPLTIDFLQKVTVKSFLVDLI